MGPVGPNSLLGALEASRALSGLKDPFEASRGFQ